MHDTNNVGVVNPVLFCTNLRLKQFILKFLNISTNAIYRSEPIRTSLSTGGIKLVSGINGKEGRASLKRGIGETTGDVSEGSTCKVCSRGAGDACNKGSDEDGEKEEASHKGGDEDRVAA